MRSRVVQVLALLWLSCNAWGAGQSLSLTPGSTGAYTIPNSSPYSALGDYRIEVRLHGFSGCPVNYPNIWYFGGIRLRCFLGGGTDLNFQDEPASRGIVFPMAGRTDATVRFQRHTSGALDLEIWNTQDGSGYAYYSATGATVGPQNVSGSRTVGDNYTSIQVAYVRWSSTLLPIGNPPPAIAASDGDLGTWLLNGNLQDSSGHNLNISFPGAVFTNTPVYLPFTSARPAQPQLASMPSALVARAGYPISLTGIGSYSFIEGATQLRYQWTQLSGPTLLTWLNSKSSTPLAVGTVFGQYVVRLTTTDTIGQRGTADLTIGVVNTDDNGIVISEDPLRKVVFGDLLQWGNSPWPYMDDRHMALADFFGGQLSIDPNLTDDWNHALAGTVTATQNSAVLTGVGTDFQNSFCNGSTTPQAGVQIVLWYLVPGGGTGRRGYNIQSCNSATQMTLLAPYATTATTAGLNYARFACPGCWYNGSGNVNYYDNVLAFYSLYYRTGITRYRDYARTLAARWWTMPVIDQSRACWFGDYGPNCPPQRVLALTGIFWYAHETGANYWAGLRQFANLFRTQTTLFDTREQGYQLAFLSLQSMLDPDPAQQAMSKQNVNQIVSQFWKPKQNSIGAWTNYSYGYESGNTTPASTVNATRGSNIITGNNTSNYWQADPSGNWIVLAGDNHAYYVTAGSTNTRLVLAEPYMGQGRTNAIYQMNNLVGYGTQPFTLGILASGLSYAYAATGNATARQLVLDIAHWLKRYGYRASTRGLYYGRFYTPCEPSPDQAPNCVFGSASDPSVIGSDRLLSGEVMGAISRAYHLSNGDSDLRNFGDNLIGAAFGKYGGPATDQYYVTELDQVIQYAKAKDFGFFFGFGASPTWAASRLNAPAPSTTRAAYIAYPTAPAPASASATISRYRADGATDTTSCSGSPCIVQVDPNQDTQLIHFDYPSAHSVVQPVRGK